MENEIESTKEEDIIVSKKKKQQIFFSKKIKLNKLLLSPYLIPYINNDITNEKNDLSFIKIDQLIQDIINMQNKERNSYNQKFNCFKKILDLKANRRKTKLDSLLKKCKSRFCKSFNLVVYKLLKKRSKYYKLPIPFVKNININYNCKHLDYTIIEIYNEYNINVDYDLLNNHINKKNYELFIYLINKTFKELYIEYLNSKTFFYESEKIGEKNGLRIKLLYKYTSKIFLAYYLKNKAKKNNSHNLFKNSEK